MRRLRWALGAALVVASMVVVGRTRTADASEWWCWDDPVLVLNGQVVHILTGVPEMARRRVTLADMVVTVPENVDAKITASPSPRFPQAARLERSGRVGPDGVIVVRATVSVAGHGRFAVGLKMTQPGGGESIVYGDSNAPLSSTMALMPKGMPSPGSKSSRAAK